MTARVPLLAVLAAALALPACRSTVEPGGDPASLRAAVPDSGAFRTDSTVYTLRATSVGVEGSIGVTFTNPTAGTTYVVNCREATGLSLQKRVGGQWTTVWSPVLPLCLSAPIVVAPGAEWRTKVWVFGGQPGSNAYPQFTTAEIPGTYRLLFHAVLSSYDDRGTSFGEPLPAELRGSNVFELRVAR